MTHQEEEACARLFINNTNVSAGENVIDSFQERMTQREKRKAGEMTGTNVCSKYHNIDYICGSTAEVE